MKPYFLCALHPSRPLSLRGTAEGDVGWVDWNERKVVAHWSTGQAGLSAVALEPSSQRCATLGKGLVKVWDDQREVGAYPIEGTNLAFAAGLLWVGRPGALVALDPSTGEVRHELLEEKFSNLSLFAVHDKTLAWSSMAAAEVLVVDASTGSIKNRIESVGEIFALAIHPDGQRLAASLTGSGNTVMHAVQIWKLETGLHERKFSIPFQAMSLAISPDGSWVVTGDAMGAQLWDYARGGPERRFALRETAAVEGLGRIERPRAGLVTAVRFDGEQLVTDGHELAVWGLSSGEREWALEVTGV
ncbi:MAG: hypothetical protein AMXMBFR33_48940 [Candidatus Xenobia bacterium]